MASFQALNARAVSAEVYDLLRDKILLCELTPGQRLDVAQISNELGVSRTPVKEALQRLSVQDLVKIHPRRGTFITEITPDDVRETFEVREALETKACELAAGRLPTTTIASLRELNQRMFGPDLHFVDHAVMDSEFHRMIIEGSGNQRLLKMYAELKAHVQIARVHYRSTAWRSNHPITSGEHSTIIDALADGRAEDAKRAMQAHIRNSMSRLISKILHPAEDPG